MDPFARLPQERSSLGRTEERRGGAASGGIRATQRAGRRPYAPGPVRERPTLCQLLPASFKLAASVAKELWSTSAIIRRSPPYQRLLASSRIDETVKRRL